MLLSFGLGDAVSFNVIIGLPTIRARKLFLDVDSNRATSKLLYLSFYLNFQHATSVLFAGIQFSSSNVVCPQHQTASGLNLLY